LKQTTNSNVQHAIHLTNCKVIEYYATLLSQHKLWPMYYYVKLITRAHSFPRPAEFRAEPRNLGFFRGIEPWNSSFYRGMPQNLTFFIRATIFHRKWPQSSSVTSLFMMIFCLMVMV